MFNDVKVLCKQAVKLDRAVEGMNPKHTKRLKRLLKRAFMLEKKIVEAVGRLMPLRDEKEVREMAKNWMSWMEARMNNRVGRIKQIQIPRSERRLMLREYYKGRLVTNV